MAPPITVASFSSTGPKHETKPPLFSSDKFPEKTSCLLTHVLELSDTPPITVSFCTDQLATTACVVKSYATRDCSMAAPGSFVLQAASAESTSAKKSCRWRRSIPNSYHQIVIIKRRATKYLAKASSYGWADIAVEDSSGFHTLLVNESWGAVLTH